MSRKLIENYISFPSIFRKNQKLFIMQYFSLVLHCFRIVSISIIRIFFNTLLFLVLSSTMHGLSEFLRYHIAIFLFLFLETVILKIVLYSTIPFIIHFRLMLQIINLKRFVLSYQEWRDKKECSHWNIL